MPISRRQFMHAGIVSAGLLASGTFTPRLASGQEDNQAVFPQHPPLGKGQGINPGRVAWMHDPKATSWNGIDFWWKPENFDSQRILAMIRNGIGLLTGEKTPQQAWHKLFVWKNTQNGKIGGYMPGQKLAIKVNMNGLGENIDDFRGQVAASYANSVLLRCLLLSLVEDGNVQTDGITVYDACRIFPDYMREMCTEGKLHGVKFRFRDPGGPEDAEADMQARINWAGKVDGFPTWLPKCVTEADYLINVGNLKGHSWGMTLTGKNHFGSFVNAERRTTPGAAGLHSNLIGNQLGDYSVITDLMANRHLGGKTILWMLDALITAPNETGNIYPYNSVWQMPPFNGHFASSLFFSQDPVAIDSVGADFLVNEPVMKKYNSELSSNHGMENYLHEAAQLDRPPSGTKYTDGNGRNPGSLGVHEHWNNSREKLYGRNRGESEGIELVKG